MLRTVESVRTAFTRTAVRVPMLSEISLRAVGSACVHLSELVALNGGVRPDVPWMQVCMCVCVCVCVCGIGWEGILSRCKCL